MSLHYRNSLQSIICFNSDDTEHDVIVAHFAQRLITEHLKSHPL